MDVTTSEIGGIHRDGGRADARDPPDGHGWQLLHARQGGLITVPGQPQYFTFTAPASGQLSVYLDNSAAFSYQRSANTQADIKKGAVAPTVQDGVRVDFLDNLGDALNTSVTVRDGNASGLIEAADAGGNGGYNSLVRLNVIAGRTYVIEAAGLGDSVGSFLLLLGLDTSAASQPLEDTFGDAVPLGLGRNGTGQVIGTIAQPADPTMYDFTATSGGLATATMDEAAGSFVDPYLYAYNAQGQLLQADDDSGGTLNSLIQFPVVAGETYYLLAAAYGTTTGAYVVNVSIGPGSTFGTAEPITLDAQGSAGLVGQIALSGQVQMYEFTATADGLVTAVQQGTSGTALDSILTAYHMTEGSDGSTQSGLIALDDVTDPEQDPDASLVFQVQAGQEYFLAASANLESTGGYVLTIATAPLPASDLPTVDLPAQGQAEFDGSVASAGVTDAFQLEADGTGLVSIFVDGGGGLLPSASVTDLSGRLISSQASSLPGEELVQFAVVGGQVYRVAVAGLNGTTGEYDLSISQAQSITLTPGGSASQDGDLDDGPQLRTYQLTATVSGAMQIQVDSLSGATLGGIVLFALDAQQQLLGFDAGQPGVEPASKRYVLIAVDAGQTYTLELAGSGIGVGYSLSIATTHGDGYGSTFQDAKGLSLGSQATTVDGAVDVPGQVDMFQIVAPTTGQLTVLEDAATGSGLDSFLVVYDDSGQQIAVNDDSGGTLNSLIDVQVRGGDTYFIQAGGYGLSTGSYVLTIEPSTPIVDDYSGFSTAHPITLLPTGAGSQSGAVIAGTGGDPTMADANAPVEATVNFYQFAAPISGSMTVQLVPGAGDSLDTVLSVFTALDGLETQIAGDDPGTFGKEGASGSSRSVTFVATAGQTYFLEVAPSSDVSVDRSFDYTLDFQTVAGGGPSGPAVDCRRARSRPTS